MKRGFVVTISGAAIVIAGLAGCSSGEKKSESTAESSASATSESTATASATASATAASGTTKVTIDGQEQNVNGTVVCATMGNNLNIAIGESTTGIGAVLSTGDNPTVHSVGLGNVNGVTLGYQEGAGQGSATAEKTDNTYKITGTATGVDMSNPTQPVSKQFEIDVTCP